MLQCWCSRKGLLVNLGFSWWINYQLVVWEMELQINYNQSPLCVSIDVLIPIVSSPFWMPSPFTLDVASSQHSQHRLQVPILFLRCDTRRHMLKCKQPFRYFRFHGSSVLSFCCSSCNRRPYIERLVAGLLLCMGHCCATTTPFLRKNSSWPNAHCFTPLPSAKPNRAELLR